MWCGPCSEYLLSLCKLISPNSGVSRVLCWFVVCFYSFNQVYGWLLRDEVFTVSEQLFHTVPGKCFSLLREHCASCPRHSLDIDLEVMWLYSLSCSGCTRAVCMKELPMPLYKNN